MNATTGRAAPELDVRMQQVAQKGVENRRKHEEEEKIWRREKRRDAKQLTEWLREVEVADAVPIMRAISKAEKVSGHRLMLRISNDFGLSSRGFRITWSTSSPRLLPTYTTSRLKSGREWCYVTDISRTKQQVRELINNPNLEKDLVYQGVDEWPTIGKICFWGIMLGFPPFGMAICASQHAAYERSYRPAVF